MIGSADISATDMLIFTKLVISADNQNSTNVALINLTYAKKCIATEPCQGRYNIMSFFDVLTWP